MADIHERTFIAVKPDGVQRNLVGRIIKKFELRGYKLVAIKMLYPDQKFLETHYQDLKEKPFFPALIKYMQSGPIVAMAWEGLDAVVQGRKILGSTNPLSSEVGTIRGDFALSTGRNVAHGSDSTESAKRELALWFGNDELINYNLSMKDNIYE